MNVVRKVLQSSAVVTVALALLTTTILWTYVNVSKLQQMLQHAQRNQTICDSNIMEFETMRYLAMLESQKNPLAFKNVLLILGIVGIVVCAGVVLGGISVGNDSSARYRGILTGNPQQPFRAAAAHIVVGVLLMGIFITLLTVVFDLYGGPKKNQLEVDTTRSYKNALNEVADLFRNIRTKLTELGDTVHGPWTRYRQKLSKRIAQTLELESTELADDMVRSYMEELSDVNVKHQAQILQFIEFHTDRDYRTLRDELVPWVYSGSNRDNVRSALDQLQNIATYDPMPTYNRRFSKIYGALFVATAVCAYAWMHMFASTVGMPVMVAIFAVIMILTILYMRL